MKVLAGMNRAIGAEIGAASEADQRAAKMEIARKAAVAESERWKRRELLVKQQIARLTKQAAPRTGNLGARCGARRAGAGA